MTNREYDDKNIWSEIYDIYYDIQFFLPRNPNTSLIKSRQLIETVIKYITKYENNRIFIGEDTILKNSINNLICMDIIPKKYENLLNDIRTYGNMAIHENLSDKNTAQYFFESLSDFLLWFISNYINDDFLQELIFSDIPFYIGRIYFFLIKEIEKSLGVNVSSDLIAAQRIREASQKAMKDITMNTIINISVPFIYGENHFEFSLDRKEIIKIIYQ